MATQTQHIKTTPLVTQLLEDKGDQTEFNLMYQNCHDFFNSDDAINYDVSSDGIIQLIAIYATGKIRNCELCGQEKLLLQHGDLDNIVICGTNRCEGILCIEHAQIWDENTCNNCHRKFCPKCIMSFKMRCESCYDKMTFNDRKLCIECSKCNHCDCVVCKECLLRHSF